MYTEDRHGGQTDEGDGTRMGTEETTQTDGTIRAAEVRMKEAGTDHATTWGL
jgi:hypothetical protein